MDLREKIAALVQEYQWDSGDFLMEAREIADRILDLPEMDEVKALDEMRRRGRA